MPPSLRPLVTLAALLLGLALPACRITPDEIQRIETENELLREQIQTMRLECEEYRQIEIGVDRSAPKEPAPGPPKGAPEPQEPPPP